MPRRLVLCLLILCNLTSVTGRAIHPTRTLSPFRRSFARLVRRGLPEAEPADFTAALKAVGPAVFYVGGRAKTEPTRSVR